MSNGSDPHQDRQCVGVGPDFGPNCLQKSSLAMNELSLTLFGRAYLIMVPIA